MKLLNFQKQSEPKVYDLDHDWMNDKYSVLLDDEKLNEIKNLETEYLCAKNEKQLHPEIIYLRTETLNEDMKRAGFSDFDIYENTQGITNYYEYLNDESINLINKFYEHDFDLFNYTKISLEK